MDVYRVNGGEVSAESVLQLVVGEDLIHGSGTGRAGTWRYNDVKVAIQVENWGVSIDRSRQAGWWLRPQQWKPGDNRNEATKFVLGVQGSVEGECPAL